MNPNYCHTITVYSRIQARDSEDRKEHWKRTVLRNCFYKSKISTVMNGTQASVQNTYTVRIPEDDRYLPYVDFVKDQKGHFTLSQDDIVVYGECTEEITGEAGNRAAELLGRHKPNAFKVTAFSDNTAFPVSKHYRLGG